MYEHLKFGLCQHIECGHLEKVKQQCKQENVNKAIFIGRTPLHIAVISSQIDIIKYLLTLNPDIQKKDDLGLTAGQWVFYLGNKHVQEIMMPFIPYTQLPHRDWSDLDIHRAAELSSDQLTKIVGKQNPHLKSQFKRSALHWAAIAGNKKSWEILIQHNLNPYVQDEFGFNPLHYLKNKYNPLYEIIEGFPVEQEQKSTDYEVLIIGAGASAIGAAITLERAGVPYLILETRDRIGGRMKSVFVDGVQMDLGACWVHSYNKNNPICKEVKRIGWKPKVSQNHYGAQIMDQFNGKVPDKLMNKARVIYEKFYAISQQTAKKSDQDLSIYESAKDYYEGVIAKLPKQEKRVVDMLINMTQHYEAASITELSAKNYDQRTDHGGDFSPSRSYASLLMEIAKGLRVKLNTNVKQIIYSQNNVKVICDGQKVFTSRKVISTIPLGLLKTKRIKFQPPLPKQHQISIDRLGFGTMNKILMAFQKPFWDQGTSWIRLAAQERGKYACMYNFSTKQKYVLCCFVTDNFARKISAWTDQQIIKDITETLAKANKNKTILLKEVYITRWDRDQNSLGSYTFFQKNSSIQNSRMLRQNIMKTLWIVGEHCYGQHIGTAHGAFQTGVWASQQIIKFLKIVVPGKQIEVPKKKIISDKKIN